MTRLTKTLLRIWLSASSVGAFALGWAALSHAPKPAPLDPQPTQPTASVQVPALEPIPSLEELVQGTAPSGLAQQSFSFNFPMLRARGS